MKNKKQKTNQQGLLVEYFQSHPNKSVPHPEVVDWVTKEYQKEQVAFLETPTEE